MDISLRRERPGDEAPIRTLTEQAFAPMAYSSGTEAPIVDDLRREGDLTLSLVAVAGGDIVGHIAFSPVTIDGKPGRWFGLGPVSVRPELQGQGIGAALVNEGLATIRAGGATGCVLIGDPRYYRRFGFLGDGTLTYRDVPPAAVQSLPFTEERATGTLRYSPAFERR